MTFDHDALRELAVAYAFGTIDAQERLEFDAHLRTCAECQQDVRDAALLAEGLALVQESEALPPDLRERVLRAATSAPRPHSQSRDAAVAPRALSTPAPAARSAWPTWFAIAAALVALVAAAAAWTAHRESASALAETARERQQVAEALQALARVQASATETARAMDIATAPDVAPVKLAGQPAAPQAAGRVFWSASHGLLFTATNLPALPPGRVYQLWYVTAGAPVSAALVSPDATGQLSSINPSVAQVQPKAFALTIEPAGGVPAPTGAFYLLGAL